MTTNLEKQPYIYIDNTLKYIQGSIAIEIFVRDEFNRSLSSLNVMAQNDFYQQAINKFLIAISDLQELDTITLRYIYDPDRIGNQFIFVCLLSVVSEQRYLIEERMKNSWEQFCLVFPRNLYSLIPAVDFASFNYFYLPIEPENIVISEIRKKEDISRPKYLATAAEYYYSPIPIQGSYNQIEQILDIIKSANNKFLVNIILSPTGFTVEEEEIIDQVIAVLARFSEGFIQHGLSGSIIFEPDQNARICLQRFYKLAQNAANLFQFKIQLISSNSNVRKIMEALSKTIATNSFLCFPENEEQLKLARHTYKNNTPYPLWGGNVVWDGKPLWETENAPTILRRISHLLTLDEAIIVFRLPTVFHERPPQTPIVTIIEKVDHMGDNKVEIHGNNYGSLQIAFDKVFGDMIQNLKTGAISHNHDVSKLIEMLQSLQNELKLADQANATELKGVSDRVQKLLDNLNSESLDKEDIDYNGNKLVTAAEKIKGVAPKILEIALGIVKFIKDIAF